MNDHVSGSLRSLRSLKEKLAKPKKTERCELCAQELSPAHQHLMDPGTRILVCCCDGCSVLFDSKGLTKYRRVPRQIRRLTDFRMPGEEWEKLLVPIHLAFFYKSSHAGKVVALYPSPAGVTESIIEPEAWSRIVELNPVLAELPEDVEAFLVNRLKERREYYLCPMDRCFELVGLLRTHWRGFSGGERVWAEVDAYLGHLRESATS